MTLSSRPVPPVEPQAGVLVHSRADRELAVAHWLLSSAPDTGQARTEWVMSGVALLRCGGLFTAVRVSGALMHAASGTENTQEIDRFLVEALCGPVFVDDHLRRYYVLVPRSTAERREWRDRPRDEHAECLTAGCFLGVPDPNLTSPGRARSRWCVPMDGPGDLCSAEAVSQLVAYGRYRLAEQAGDSR